MAGARVNVFTLDLAQGLESETFDGKAAHHGTVNHRSPQGGVIHFANARQIAHETAGEAVTRASWIMHFFHGQRWYGKDSVIVNHDRTVLAALYHQRFRTQRKNVTSGAKQ